MGCHWLLMASMAVAILRALFWITSRLSRWDHIFGWTRWGRHSWGWSARWPCRWPPTFRLWSPSYDIEGPRSLPDTIVGMRAEGQVGVQRDTQGFRGSVQLSHWVADLHLRVESGLVRVRLDFWGAMACCLPSVHLTSVDQSRLALASASTMLGAEVRKVKSSA